MVAKVWQTGKEDLAFVTVEAVDDKGRRTTNAGEEMHFAVSGAATIAAVGNGDGQARESYSGNTFRLFEGRALVVLRSSSKAGEIKLTANADGLSGASILIHSKMTANGAAELRQLSTLRARSGNLPKQVRSGV